MAFTNWGSNESRKRKRDDYEDDTEMRHRFHDRFDNETISRNDNHLYFYDNVNTKNNLKFTTILREIDNEQQIKKTRGEIVNPTIHIHINSGGGSLLDGFSMASAVLSCKSHTIGYVEAMAASAATLPFVVCKERKMQQFCYILIHQLSSRSWGTYEHFNDEKKNLDNFMTQLNSLYLKYTKIPERKLKEILKHDLFWDIDTCKKYKIVDEVC